MKRIFKNPDAGIVMSTPPVGITTSTPSIDTYLLDRSSGFTIVELLVVIVVIAILAAITIVSYTGITTKANTAVLQSDLANNTQVLKLYYTLNGSYPITLNPTTNCPALPVADTTNCLKLSSNNQLAYSPMDTANPTSPQNFRLTVSDATAKTNYSTNAASLNCPVNFIIVPGSLTYNTNDFCVMKYNAKQVGNTTTPISQAAGLPWVAISQTTAMVNSANVADCKNCHLITEAEWMTIAQNVLSVASNWSSGTVGIGYIYSGHNDNVPANALAASPDDNDGYYGTGNSSSSGANQKRTLTLSNGEVIWDMAGNVYEWTSGQATGGQPGVVGNTYTSWIQWTSVTTVGSLAVNPFPGGTGIQNSSTWNSANGIGQVYSSVSETVLRGFVRSGYWYLGNRAGLLYLGLSIDPSSVSGSLGFRVSTSNGL